MWRLRRRGNREMTHGVNELAAGVNGVAAEQYERGGALSENPADRSVRLQCDVSEVAGPLQRMRVALAVEIEQIAGRRVGGLGAALQDVHVRALGRQPGVELRQQRQHLFGIAVENDVAPAVEDALENRTVRALQHFRALEAERLAYAVDEPPQRV